MSDRAWPEVDLREAAAHGIGDHAIRFLFGAAIALVAGVIGMALGPKLGGVFLGFPAILPASLTLIQKRSGKEKAAVDSLGAILGASALVVFALLSMLLVTRLGVVPALVISLTAWLLVAIALYALIRRLVHREPSPP